MFQFSQTGMKGRNSVVYSTEDSFPGSDLEFLS